MLQVYVLFLMLCISFVVILNIDSLPSLPNEANIIVMMNYQHINLALVYITLPDILTSMIVPYRVVTLIFFLILFPRARHVC